MNKLSVFLLTSLSFYSCSKGYGMDITKVIIPAGGLGTRLMPGTKAVPKEMFPILDGKPAIHYVVDAAIKAGMQEVVIITAPYKQALENYFTPQPEINALLEKSKKLHLIKEVEDMIAKTTFTFITQPKPAGLGDAILLAEKVVGDNFFAVALPDDIIVGEQPELSHLIKIAKEQKATVITVAEIPWENVSAYGVVKIKQQLSNDLFEIEDVVEKPRREDAPSNFVISGHYVFSPSLFDSLKKVKPSPNGELYPTDAMVHMMREKGEKIYAYRLQGTRYDVGVPEGVLRATVSLALQNPDYKKLIKELMAGK